MAEIHQIALSQRIGMMQAAIAAAGDIDRWLRLINLGRPEERELMAELTGTLKKTQMLLQLHGVRLAQIRRVEAGERETIGLDFTE